ncbi:septum formation initiator family protein [bacterium]|nr:septum formation initiator family protein [bacterium]
MNDQRVTLSLKYKAVVAVGFVLLGLCAVSAVFGSGGVVQLRRLYTEQSQVEAQAYELARHNQELRDHLARIDADDAYLEKVVRERLGWIKPGERLYRVTDERR